MVMRKKDLWTLKEDRDKKRTSSTLGSHQQEEGFGLLESCEEKEEGLSYRLSFRSKPSIEGLLCANPLL